MFIPVHRIAASVHACLAAAALALVCGPVAGQMYRYVDANGQVHFTNTPPSGAAQTPPRPAVPPPGRAQQSTPAAAPTQVQVHPTAGEATPPRTRSLVALPAEPAPVSMPRIPEGDDAKAGEPANTIAATQRTPGAAGARVVMYSTSWCPYCARARAFFKHYRIEYAEIDIERDEAGRAAYRKLGGRGVPFIIIGEQAIRGFDEQRLSAALGVQ